MLQLKTSQFFHYRMHNKGVFLDLGVVVMETIVVINSLSIFTCMS